MAPGPTTRRMLVTIAVLGAVAALSLAARAGGSVPCSVSPGSRLPRTSGVFRPPRPST